jgi:GT2 family glycosyltransferase
MSGSETRVAVVIPVYNRRDTTLLGLKSLLSVKTSGIKLQIFVVDDGSTDGTSEAIQLQFPEVIVIQGTGDLHYAAGTNWGIEAALNWAPDYIVTMNDDAVIHEDIFHRMISTAEQNPRSIIGALLLLWDEPHKVFQVDVTWRTFQGGWVMPSDLTAFSVPQEPFDVDVLVGNCLLFPVAAILDGGLMDGTRFPDGWGDAQYLARMKHRGWRLLVHPKAYMWCEPNTYPAPLHQTSIKQAARNLFLNRRHPTNLWRQFIARWESAPSRLLAVVAYTIFVAQIGVKTVTLGSKKLLR